MGVERFEGDLVSNRGKISPGRRHAPSTTELTTIDGNLTDTFGTLVIELGGTSPGVTHDTIAVTGDVSLMTSLDVSLVNDFELQPGQTFEILDVGGTFFGGFFGIPDGGSVGVFGGEELWITFSGGDGNDLVLYTTELPGNYDGDGDVDGADFLAWQRTDGSTGELADWQTNYGITSNPPEAATSVPEPSSLLICLFGGLMFVTRKR